MDEIIRLHASTGTTGKPTVVGYTRNDIETWAEVMARTLVSAGAHKGDIIQVAYGYGLFTGGLGAHYGAEKIGAAVVPVSTGNTKRQITLLQDFGTTVLVSTPSYALFLAEQSEELGIDRASLELRLGLFGGEPCSAKMKAEIETKLGLRATDNYGLSEVMGPGVAGECELACGLHVNEDHLLLEVIDPASEEPLGYGEEGELVITTLTKEAFPIFRYRTHDLTTLDPSRCDCGRTLVRMKKVRQRTDDMLIIRGVNVYPSQIEDVLLRIEGVRPHYLIVIDQRQNLDDLEVRLEVADGVFSDVMADMAAFQRSVADKLQSTLGLRTRVTLVEPGTIERTAGKAKRVLDLRGGE
jgi:phenylacetate-CoA ligase